MFAELAPLQRDMQASPPAAKVRAVLAKYGVTKYRRVRGKKEGGSYQKVPVARRCKLTSA